MRGPIFQILVISTVALMGCSEGFAPVASSVKGKVCMEPSPATTTSATTLSDSDPYHGEILSNLNLNGDDVLPDEFVLAVNVNCLKTTGMSGAVLPTLEMPSALGSDVTTIKMQSSASIEEVRDLLENENCVMGAAANLKLSRLALPTDPLVANQRHLSTSIGYPAAYDLFFQDSTTLSEEIIVAVVDDGIDLDHQDLRANIWVNAAEQAGLPNVDDDNNGYVDDLHGYDFIGKDGNGGTKSTSSHATHVAGLIGASANNGLGGMGIMPTKIKIMSLNIFGNADSTEPMYIDEAIRYAADNGARVINLSVGGRGTSPTTVTAINYAISKGAIVIAAAGNDGRAITAADFFAPAGYAASINGFISVGASDVGNNNALCSFSNFGANYVEIAAPGCDQQNSLGLISTALDDQYIRYNGTSMASPIVAASAALATSYFKSQTGAFRTPAQIETVLLTQTQKVAAYTNRVKGNSHLQLNLLYDGLLAITTALATDPAPVCSAP